MRSRFARPYPSATADRTPPNVRQSCVGGTPHSRAAGLLNRNGESLS